MLNFYKHSANLFIEGNKCEELISKAMAQGIILKNIFFVSDIEFRVTVCYSDLKHIKSIAGNKFRITVVSEHGVIVWFRTLTARKGLLIGFVIMIAILFYRQAYISEIQITGYRSIPESVIRESLADAGLYTGCRRGSIDTEQVINNMYIKYGNISWMGITFKGALATVELSENNEADRLKNVKNSDQPCNIISEKDAIIDKLFPLQGVAQVKAGDYVTKGALLISGMVPINNITFDTSRNDTFRYVHAMGDVWGKVKYQWECEFDAGTYTEAKANREIRKKIPANVQILNKDLKLDKGENIVKVHITVETLEKIGTEEPLNGGSQN